MSGFPTAIAIGTVFGRLTVIEWIRSQKRPNRPGRYRCRCECGAEKIVHGCALRLGTIKSCGCFHRDDARARFTKHGHAPGKNHSSPYRIWSGIIQRCHNPNNPSFYYYGGRGIVLCERWRRDFTAFLADVGPRPSPAHSLDRIDVNRGYEPGNVRWATRLEQARNKTTTKLELHEPAQIRWLASDGYSIPEIASFFGISRGLAANVVAGRAWT